MSDLCIAGHSFHILPAKLRERPQWVIWRGERRQDSIGNTKATKIPWSPRSPRRASVNDPSTWGSFSEAVQALEDGRGDGVGFVFTTEDPYVGIDLDKCRDPATGDIEPWAQEIIAQLDSYTEISPSGTGVHAIAIGTLPPGGRRKGQIEMYDRNRYFCMTGQSIDEVPKKIEERQAEIEALHVKTFGPHTPDSVSSTPENPPRNSASELDDDVLLDLAREARNGDRFSRLFDRGDISDYPSQSEADMALCSHLAFWTNSDRAQMDLLFRRSSLFRPKWDESHSADGRTYGVMTIEKAIAGATDGYKGSGQGGSTPAADGQQAQATESPCDARLESAGRPTISVVGGALPATVDAAEEALLSSNGEQIYHRGGLLMRVIRRDSMTIRGGIKRASGAPIIVPVELAYLVERLTRAAQWQTIDGRSKAPKTVDCPRKVAETYMARGVWRIPRLRGIIEAPTLRPDGSLLDRPGYDEKTGLLFDPGDTQFEPIPDMPTADEGKAACQALREILDEFPFVTRADESVALSAMLAGLVRRSLRFAPIHAFRSPKMRSGKTTLADLVSLLSTGRSCAVMSQAKDQEDERKRLLAVLLSGDPVICYDNIDRPFGGAALAQALTQEEITDRILGMSKTATVSTSATFLATGNNLTFQGDITARALACDLDPELERPEEREFKRRIYEYLPEHRGRLVAAALTLLRAFHVAGRPDPGLPRWAGFDEWSGLIRAALVWADLPDPCETRARIEDQDPVRRSLSTLLAAWEAHIGAAPMTVADVKREAVSPDTVADEPTGIALRDALMDVAGRKGEINTRVLGSYLQANEKRIEGGLRVERAGKRSGAVLWSVVRVSGGGAP